MANFEKTLHFSGNIEDFIKPTLTENGTLGGKEFAVSASSEYDSSYKAYKSIANTSGQYACVSKNMVVSETNPWYYTLYFPKGAKLTSVEHTNRSNTTTNLVKTLVLQVSDDETHWTDILTYTNTVTDKSGVWFLKIPENVQGFYRYYRYKVIASYNTASSTQSIGFINPKGIWRSTEIKEVPLFTKDDVNLKSPIDGSDISAPIIMDKKLVYAAYGSADNQWALPIKCKVPNKLYSTEVKYYKNVVFEQPILDADGISGGDFFAVEVSKYAIASTTKGGRAYHAFDGDGTTYWRSGTTTGWIQFYNPSPLKVSSLIWGFTYSYPTGGTVQGSNDGVIWDTLSAWSNSVEADITINVNSDKAYKYHRVNITGVNKDYIHCTNLKINATCATEVYPTDSYDFIVTNELVVPTYYKYVPWTQPVLTSNTSYGTVSASSVSATGFEAYKALDGITEGVSGDKTWWEAKSGVKTGNWKWVLPEEIIVTGIKLYARGNNNTYITGRFYADADKKQPIGDIISTAEDSPWTPFDVQNIPTQGVKANCIYFDITGGSSAGYVGIGELKIEAKTLTMGTESDYDFVEYNNTQLLDWQITDGSYTFTSAGTFTFTIPRGVHTIYVTCGSSSSSEYSQSIYGNGMFWANIGRYYWSEGESSGYSTYGESHYVEVSSGKTYTITINSSSMSSYPKISWSKAINNTAYTKDGRID